MSEWLNAHFDIFLCPIKNPKNQSKIAPYNNTKPCKGAISTVGCQPYDHKGAAAIQQKGIQYRYQKIGLGRFRRFNELVVLDIGT